MFGYVLRRLAGAMPTLFIIVTIAFFMIRLAPGGPFDLERPLDPLIMENLNRAYNFDKPLWQQYCIYLGNLLQGDLGPSFTRRDFTVVDLFRTGLPVSIRSAALAISIALFVGTLLGALAALRQNSWVDYAVVGTATLRHHHPDLRHRAAAQPRSSASCSAGCRPAAGTAAASPT